jgi:hypothetical protein
MLLYIYVYHIYSPEGDILIGVGKCLKFVEVLVVVSTIKIVGFYFIYNYIDTLIVIVYCDVL